ncbi:MAG: hypothetical protein FWE94_07000 [Coriobacteriia bacterium]|nr:hypothetical protein [Coriobacteriia bacterium]
MAAVLYAFAVLAGAGLIASAVVHVLSLVGAAFPFLITLPDSVFALHFGIFIVWLPTVLASSKITERSPEKDFWKTALRGAPKWVRIAAIVFSAYALASMPLGIIFLSFAASDLAPTNEVGVFSAFWMAFYAAAAATLYSAANILRFDLVRRCTQGHPVVSLAAAFCEQCGSPVLDKVGFGMEG